MKPFRDLNILTFFSFRSPARNASGFIQFRGRCVSACRCVRWQGRSRQRINYKIEETALSAVAS